MNNDKLEQPGIIPGIILIGLEYASYILLIVLILYALIAILYLGSTNIVNPNDWRRNSLKKFYIGALVGGVIFSIILFVSSFNALNKPLAFTNSIVTLGIVLASFVPILNYLSNTNDLNQDIQGKVWAMIGSFLPIPIMIMQISLHLTTFRSI